MPVTRNLAAIVLILLSASGYGAEKAPTGRLHGYDTPLRKAAAANRSYLALSEVWATETLASFVLVYPLSASGTADRQWKKFGVPKLSFPDTGDSRAAIENARYVVISKNGPDCGANSLTWARVSKERLEEQNATAQYFDCKVARERLLKLELPSEFLDEIAAVLTSP